MLCLGSLSHPGFFPMVYPPPSPFNFSAQTPVQVRGDNEFVVDQGFHTGSSSEVPPTGIGPRLVTRTHGISTPSALHTSQLNPEADSLLLQSEQVESTHQPSLDELMNIYRWLHEMPNQPSPIAADHLQPSGNIQLPGLCQPQVAPILSASAVTHIPANPPRNTYANPNSGLNEDNGNYAPIQEHLLVLQPTLEELFLHVCQPQPPQSDSSEQGGSAVSWQEKVTPNTTPPAKEKKYLETDESIGFFHEVNSTIRQLKIDTRKSGFGCKKCPFVTRTLVHIRDHVYAKHLGRRFDRFKCLECLKNPDKKPFMSNSETSTQKHCRTQHVEKSDMPSCHFCGTNGRMDYLNGQHPEHCSKTEAHEKRDKRRIRLQQAKAAAMQFPRTAFQ